MTSYTALTMKAGEYYRDVDGRGNGPVILMGHSRGGHGLYGLDGYSVPLWWGNGHVTLGGKECGVAQLVAPLAEGGAVSGPGPHSLSVIGRLYTEHGILLDREPPSKFPWRDVVDHVLAIIIFTISVLAVAWLLEFYGVVPASNSCQ